MSLYLPDPHPQRSIFHGCIVPPLRWNHQRERFAYAGHGFLTKKLWQRKPAPTFLQPSFFAAPALGSRTKERDLVLFGEEFLELEERFEAFLDELESVLRELRWSEVHASFHGQRSGTHTFTWRAKRRFESDDPRGEGPTQDWDFDGPRTIPILHDGRGPLPF